MLLFGEFGITADAAGAPAVDLDALQAVQRCDLERMQGLLSDLTDHECQKLLTRGVDDSGRQLLHIAASKGSEEDAADMARLLLDYGAPMGGADFAGETPLSLAVAASLDAVLRGTVEGEKGASKDGSAWAALDTIRVLLVAGASPSDAIGLSSSTSKLREALQEHPEDVADLCRLLQAFGAEFQTDAEDPDADASEDRDFTEDRESVPPDLEKRLGSLGAKVVMASCSKWRQMNAKQLRAECAEVGIPTDGCVEKGELIERLAMFWNQTPQLFGFVPNILCFLMPLASDGNSNRVSASATDAVYDAHAHAICIDGHSCFGVDICLYVLLLLRYTLLYFQEAKLQH